MGKIHSKAGCNDGSLLILKLKELKHRYYIVSIYKGLWIQKKFSLLKRFII